MQRFVPVQHHQGDLSHETIKKIISLTEQKMEVAGERVSVRRKVIGVMIESLQNIARHQDKRPGGQHGHPSFFIGRSAKEYKIVSCNPVCKSKVPRLKASLQKTNALDRRELASLHKATLQNNPLSEKGGAGLGLVEMAMKSGARLAFDFPEISDGCCLFCLEVTISSEHRPSARSRLKQLTP